MYIYENYTFLYKNHIPTISCKIALPVSERSLYILLDYWQLI